MGNGRPKGFKPGPLIRVKADDLKQFMEDRCARGFYFVGGRSAYKERLDTFKKFLKACEGCHPVRMYNGGELVGRIKVDGGESVPGLNENMAGHQEEPKGWSGRTQDMIVANEPPIRTINLTPTWRGLMPSFCAVLESGTPEGKKAVRGELDRLAGFGDALNGKSLCDKCDQPLVQMVDEMLKWLETMEGKPLAIGAVNFEGGLLWRIKRDISKRKGEVV